MLIGNITQIAQYPIRYNCYNGCAERSLLGINSSSHLLRFLSLSKKSAIPEGYTTGAGAWFPPLKAGGMALRTSGSGSMTIYSANITMTGSGDITTNILIGLGNIIANMTGSCTLSIEGSLITQLGMVCDMIGQGNISANITAFGDMVANLLGSGGLSGLPAGVADMSVDIIVTGTGLNTANVGAAVWNALATEFNKSGTMGAKLNSAASGGVDYNALAEAVWDAEVSGRTGSQAGNVLEKAKLIPALL